MSLLGLLYAKALVNTYLSLYPFDGVPENEIEGLAESRYQTLTSELVENNCGFLPDYTRAILELFATDSLHLGVKNEGRKIISELCGFNCLRDKSKMQLEDCEKKINAILKYIND